MAGFRVKVYQLGEMEMANKESQLLYWWIV
jgi:hypothetical protein